jgi:hypothetical protein
MPEPKPRKDPPRQAVLGMLKALTQRTIDRKDVPFGKQLATICEQQALVLRSIFGGKPMWHVGTERKAKAEPVKVPKGVTYKLVPPPPRQEPKPVITYGQCPECRRAFVESERCRYCDVPLVMHNA